MINETCSATCPHGSVLPPVEPRPARTATPTSTRSGPLGSASGDLGDDEEVLPLHRPGAGAVFGGELLEGPVEGRGALGIVGDVAVRRDRGPVVAGEEVAELGPRAEPVDAEVPLLGP